MKIHLVGGFLGSGKTTAIATACKILAEKGITSSVITNDQGECLVDSMVMKEADIPYAEVTGGCFCCNYNQLDSQIDILQKDYNPSSIFAEFVGSCTDLIATVLKPLLQYRESDVEQVTFSSFVDAQLLLMHLQGKTLPFNDETNYIWEKQIEEAEILIVNKIDLLSHNEFESLQTLIKELYTSKIVLLQNSLERDSIENWIEVLANSQKSQEHNVIDIDYEKYGAGEANLAWLDEEIEIASTNRSSVAHAYDFIKKLSNDIVEKKFPIGHLKFFIKYNNQSSKISYTTVLDEGRQDPVSFEESGSVYLLINARIQSSPDELSRILFNNLNELKLLEGVAVTERFLSYFQPGFPNPIHRFN
ncbi:MAG: GTP-binding protein [Mariniphaga sp.]